MTEIDYSRFPHELAGAIEAQGVLVEQLQLGLSVVVADGTMQVFEAGTREPVALVPMHRLERIDADQAYRVAVALAEETCSTSVADQFRADVAAGNVELHDDPTADDVAVVVRGRELMRIHRAFVVPSWPLER